MKILHLDIETAPNKAYVWGLWGQNISINQIEEPGYTLCWAAKWDHKKQIMFSNLRDEGEDNLIHRIWNLMNEADAIVHYNGNKFDIPVLNWEFALADLPPPDPSHQIDLYRVVKRNFKIPSYKLDYVAQQFGLGQKVHHKGMELWKECMDGDEKAWKEMAKYNKQDVRLLPRLYRKLLPWIKNHPNHALFVDDTNQMCPNCGSHDIIKKGTETTASQAYQRYRCKSCGTPLRGKLSTLSKEKRANMLTQSKL